MNAEGKKRVFSGAQPTGKLTIGNYLGAIKNWTTMQDEYECLFCVVDLHSITIAQDPAELRKKTMELLALYLACGIDPEKSIVFLQSHVSAHTELAWVLDTMTYVGELNRMTQYKEKSRKHTDNLNTGLMNYPVLMASDILLYQTDVVPVGKDQKQHLELTRTLAERFNNRYSPTFVVPEAYIAKQGAKIMSLQDPKVKMSKSDENENASIYLSDDEATVLRKCKRAVTDSDTQVRYAPTEKPAISNLLTIYSLCTGKKISECEKEFEGKGYGEFKTKLAESISAILKPIQQKQAELLQNKAYLESVMKQGAEKANYLAQKTLQKVYKKVGFIPKVR